MVIKLTKTDFFCWLVLTLGIGFILFTIWDAVYTPKYVITYTPKTSEQLEMDRQHKERQDRLNNYKIPTPRVTKLPKPQNI
jgi:hypothetical protein